MVFQFQDTLFLQVYFIDCDPQDGKGYILIWRIKKRHADGWRQGTDVWRRLWRPRTWLWARPALLPLLLLLLLLLGYASLCIINILSSRPLKMQLLLGGDSFTLWYWGGSRPIGASCQGTLEEEHEMDPRVNSRHLESRSLVKPSNSTHILCSVQMKPNIFWFIAMSPS